MGCIVVLWGKCANENGGGGIGTQGKCSQFVVIWPKVGDREKDADRWHSGHHDCFRN